MKTSDPAGRDSRLMAARQELNHLVSNTESGAAESLKQTYADVWSDTESALELIYAEYVARENLGQSPDRDAWLQRYPQWRDRLERLFAVGELFSQDAFQREHSQPIDNPPGYEILGTIGQGASAIVYKARQTSLNRLVAIKVFHDINPAARNRIAREGELAARLQHANIVPIYEVGEWQGQPFLTMEYVAGGTLDAEQLSDWSFDKIAELLETIARAMHYAHKMGVVHRDLKPSNILIQSLETPPYFLSRIADFGLAINFDSRQSLTESIALAGTPCYMAPEQANARTDLFGPRSDIYALGAILYELLTLRPPYCGASIIETLDMVRHTEPVKPRLIRPSIPRDLETICLKCLEKDPSQRYATAVDLADDLQRFRAGQAISARPVGSIEHAWKWVRRHPAIAALSLAFVIVLSSAVVAQSVNYRIAEAAHRKERQLNHDLQRSLAEQSIGAARALWNGGQLEASKQTLVQCPPHLRSTDWHELNRLCNAHVACWTGPEYAATKLAVSPDGSRLALRRRAGSKTIDILDAVNGIFQFEVPSTIPLQMEFAADGQSLMVLQPVGDSSNATFTMADVVQDNFARELVVWNLVSKSVTRRWPIPGRGGAINRWGSRVASWNADTITVWETNDGKVVAELPQRTGRRLLPQLAISDDAKKLAIRLGSDDIHIWDIEAKCQVLSFPAGPAIVMGMFQFQAGGQRLYSFNGELGAKPAETTQRPFIHAWDVASGQTEFQIPGRAPVVLTTSPAGKLLAHLSDRAIDLYDAASGVKKATLLGHTDRIACITFSPDGKHLYSGAADNTLRTWDVSSWAE